MRKVWVALAGLCLTTCAMAQDGNVKAELADLKAKIAALESARDAEAAFEEENEGVVSLRKNGLVTIGGSAWIAAYTSSYERGQPLNDVNADTHAARKDKLVRTSFMANSADLNINVKATDNITLYTTLDLKDAFDGDYSRDDILKEFYFDFSNLFCRNMGVKFGKMEAPIGLHKDDLLLSPYTVGGSDLGFFEGTGNTASEGEYDMYDHYPGKIEKVFGISTYATFFRDMVTLESMFFQDNYDFETNTYYDGYRVGGPDYGYGYGYGSETFGARDLFSGSRRTNDDFLVRSFATRLTVSPLEGLDVIASYAARYNRAAHNKYAGLERAGADDDGNYFNPAYTRFWHIYSAAIDYKLPWIPVELFVEYQRGQNNGFYKDNWSNDIHFGSIISFRDNIRLNLQGEWLETHNKSYNYDGAGFDRAKNRYWRALVAVEYDLPCDGPTLEAGWQGEWYRRTSNYTGGTDRKINDFKSYGNIWYAGVKYDF